MGFAKQAVDAETFHINTLMLHGEVRKASVETNSWNIKKDGVETGEVRESQSIIIKVDDDNEDRIELIDRDVSHLDQYEKGVVGTFRLRLDITKEFGNKYTAKVNVVEFIPDKKKRG